MLRVVSNGVLCYGRRLCDVMRACMEKSVPRQGFFPCCDGKRSCYLLQKLNKTCVNQEDDVL